MINKFKPFLEIIFNYILFLFLLLPLWLNKKFGFVYYDQLLFNLELATLGVLEGDYRIIRSGIKWLIITPLILSFFLYLARYLFINKKLNKKRVNAAVNKLVNNIFFPKKKNLLISYFKIFFKLLLKRPVYIILILIIQLIFIQILLIFLKIMKKIIHRTVF